MLELAIGALLIALIAGALSSTGIARAASTVAKIAFDVFLIIAVGAPAARTGGDRFVGELVKHGFTHPFARRVLLRCGADFPSAIPATRARPGAAPGDTASLSGVGLQMPRFMKER